MLNLTGKHTRIRLPFSSQDEITACYTDTEKQTPKATAKNCPLHLQWRKQQRLVDPNYPAFISGFGVKQEQATAALQDQRAALSDLSGKKLIQYNNYCWSRRNVLDQMLPK